MEQDVGDRGKKSREKHKCPYLSCNANVVHLPRHMREVHGWDKMRSKGVIGTFDLRKVKSRKTESNSGNKKREYKRRMCPIKTCGSVVKRILNHFVEVHNVKRGTRHYQQLLNAAKIYDPPVISIDSSSSETSESSTNLEESEEGTKIKQPRKKRRKSVYRTVYHSDDDPEGKSENEGNINSGIQHEKENKKTCGSSKDSDSNSDWDDNGYKYVENKSDKKEHGDHEDIDGGDYEYSDEPTATFSSSCNDKVILSNSKTG